MNLSIDVTSLGSGTLTGIGVYIQNLIPRLAEFSDLSVTGRWYAEKYRRVPAIRGRVSIPLKPYFHYFSGLNIDGVDVFHGPDFRIPFTRRMKKVVTVCDLVDFEQTIVDSRKAARGTRRLTHTLRTDRPDRIICISAFTRDQLIRYFPELENRAVVVPLGVDHLPVERESPRRPVDQPYLLFVGNIERRKNIVTAIKAFEIAREKHPDLRFVIVGKNGYRSDEIEEAIRVSPHREAILRPGYVSTDEVIALYRHAEAFVFPSWYEGFGIPILEAMRLDCPVLTSRTGAMKEVSGDAAIHVDPADADAIAHEIVSLLETPSRREFLIAAGRIQSAQFTWRRCAELTREVYRELSGT